MERLQAKNGNAFLPVEPRLLKRLASLALPERWSWGDNEFGLLERYLYITFERVLEQEKVAYCHDGQGDMAIMATGLVDSSFENVYCVFEPASGSGRPEWMPKAFCAFGGTRYGRRIARIDSLERPMPATYVESPEELFVKAGCTVEADIQALVSQCEKIPQEIVEGIAGGNQQAIGDALRLALEVARARLRYSPLCAVPAWGPAVGLDGLVFCVPLCLVDTQHCDVVLALSASDTSQDGTLSYLGKALLSVSEASLAARILRMPYAGMGWLYDEEASEEAERKPECDISEMRARLTCKDMAMPPFVVHSGNTVGVLRRQFGEKPNIVFPKVHGFEGISQIQGRFLAHSDGQWEFVHEGSNWTLVRHSKGTESVLREKGASAMLLYGDTIIFSGSPAFVLGR